MIKKRLFPVNNRAWHALLIAGLVQSFGFGALIADDGPAILPGDAAFYIPEFVDYEARYTSSSSKTGEFTLHVRLSGDGRKMSLIDMIPMENSVIVAQRQIDMASQRLEFSAGPYFAWGAEFIVSQSDGKTYDWARVPIGGGVPKRAEGAISHQGYVSEMFSPLLASLMPMDEGSQFRLPASYARQGEFVSSELDEYTVLRREKLDTPAGLMCECWLIEKRNWGGSTERIWVDRKAPFVFRRHRDVGGRRDFVSELTAYRALGK